MTLRFRLLLAIALLLPLVGGGLSINQRLSRAPTAYALVDETTLVVLRGTVEVQRSGAATTVTVSTDAPLRVGDRVRTSPDSYASITFFEGSTTTLEPNTEIVISRLDKLPNGGTFISLRQEFGVTWNRVERLIDADSRFETTTVSAVIFVRGTEYRVEVEPAGRITVQAVTDVVRVRQETEPEEQAVVLEPGFQIIIERGQPPTAPQPLPPPRLVLRVGVQGNALPFLTDSVGRSLGFHPESEIDAYTSQIPGAIYGSAGNQQTLDVPDPRDGAYQLVFKARDRGGEYVVTVAALAGGTPASASQSKTGSVGQGQRQGATFTFQDGQVLRLSDLTFAGGAPPESRVRFVTSQLPGRDIIATAVAQITSTASPTATLAPGGASIESPTPSAGAPTAGASPSPAQTALAATPSPTSPSSTPTASATTIATITPAVATVSQLPTPPPPPTRPPVGGWRNPVAHALAQVSRVSTTVPAEPTTEVATRAPDATLTAPPGIASSPSPTRGTVLPAPTSTPTRLPAATTPSVTPTRTPLPAPVPSTPTTAPPPVPSTPVVRRGGGPVASTRTTAPPPVPSTPTAAPPSNPTPTP